MKRLIKRKMYQKRRKKEKANQRKKATQSMPFGSPSTCYNYNKTRNRFQLNTANNNVRQKLSQTPITSYSQGLQLWWQTYCSAIEFHTKQQNAWHDDSQENRLMLLEKYANEYETSSEEEEDVLYERPNSNEANFTHENNESVEELVDEGYIKFLEITHKHQEELRLKRATDNL